ncbi:MAG: polysaccharide biosynthesis C-terminal domain-containing protein, partial [Aquificaceae bacterium]|nr:polysaccharide biosynthesis C-terminal domain-containing protein [Aquificaceae bacterium]
IAGKVLAVYSLGLVFFSLQKVLASVFFAKGDTRTPVLSSLFAVLSEGLLAFLFAFLLKLGVVGLALGTSSSSLTGFLFLLYFWRERNIDLPLYAYSLLKGAAGTALMCLFLIFTRPKSYELLYAIPFAVLLYWFFLLLVREPLAYLPLSLFKSLVKKLINSGSSP